MKSNKEIDIQVFANGVLRRLNIPFIHIEKGSHDHSRTHRKGIPDILGWHRSRAFALELKRPGTKPKPEQLEYLAKLHAEGVLVGVVRSEDEFLNFLKANSIGMLPHDKKVERTWLLDLK